jgi:RNA recognition motif-containing protein
MQDFSQGPPLRRSDGQKPKSISEEKASRTLFIRNVSYGTPEKEVVDLFAKYGEIKRVFNLILKRGMAFITFVTFFFFFLSSLDDDFSFPFIYIFVK